MHTFLSLRVAFSISEAMMISITSHAFTRHELLHALLSSYFAISTCSIDYLPQASRLMTLAPEMHAPTRWARPLPRTAAAAYRPRLQAMPPSFLDDSALFAFAF